MIDPVAFNLFGLEIRWYGIIIASGMALALSLAYQRAPSEGVDREDLLDILLPAIPMGVIGARLYYVLFNLEHYNSLKEVLNLRSGGLAIHGALILGIATAIIVCKYKKLQVLRVFDLLAPSLALAQAIGRWGNFMNGEAHGGPTDLPWAITINGQKVHPTFLYESLWCLALCIFLLWLAKGKKFHGQLTFLYFILYSIERFFVEGLRTDSLMIGQFKQAQLLSLGLIIAATIAYIHTMKKYKKPLTNLDDDLQEEKD